MDFAALKARLRVSLKNPTISDLSDPDCGTYINSGYTDLSGRYPAHQTRKRCSFDTVASQAKYQLPLDISAVLRLRNSTLGYKLSKKGDRHVANRGIPIIERCPREYVRYRNYVELLPTPDAVYTIEVFYLALQVLLANDSDVPVLPDNWHDGIWMRAKWYYFMDHGDLAQQTNALNAYTIWLSDKPSEIDEESRDIDSGVELPELTRVERSFASAGSQFDDGFFDYRD